MNAVNIGFAANNGNTIIQKLNQNSKCTFPEEPGFCNTIAGANANIHASMNSLIVEKQAQKNGCEGTNCTDSANIGAATLGSEQAKIIQRQNQSSLCVEPGARSACLNNAINFGAIVDSHFSKISQKQTQINICEDFGTCQNLANNTAGIFSSSNSKVHQIQQQINDCFLDHTCLNEANNKGAVFGSQISEISQTQQ